MTKQKTIGDILEDFDKEFDEETFVSAHKKWLPDRIKDFLIQAIKDYEEFILSEQIVSDYKTEARILKEIEKMRRHFWQEEKEN